MSPSSFVSILAAWLVRGSNDGQLICTWTPGSILLSSWSMRQFPSHIFVLGHTKSVPSGLSWNSLYRADWPQTQTDLSASVPKCWYYKHEPPCLASQMSILKQPPNLLKGLVRKDEQDRLGLIVSLPKVSMSSPQSLYILSLHEEDNSRAVHSHGTCLVNLQKWDILARTRAWGFSSLGVFSVLERPGHVREASRETWVEAPLVWVL